MATCRNSACMPNVRASSATIGTMCLPRFGIAQQLRQHLHEHHRGGLLAAARCPRDTWRARTAAAPAMAEPCRRARADNRPAPGGARAGISSRGCRRPACRSADASHPRPTAAARSDRGTRAAPRPPASSAGARSSCPGPSGPCRSPSWSAPESRWAGPCDSPPRGRRRRSSPGRGRRASAGRCPRRTCARRWPAARGTC